MCPHFNLTFFSLQLYFVQTLSSDLGQILIDKFCMKAKCLEQSDYPQFTLTYPDFILHLAQIYPLIGHTLTIVWPDTQSSGAPINLY